jgi:hypothetical protein
MWPLAGSPRWLSVAPLAERRRAVGRNETNVAAAENVDTAHPGASVALLYRIVSSAGSAG